MGAEMKGITIEELKKENEMLKMQVADMSRNLEVMKSITSIFSSSYLVDLTTGKYVEVTANTNLHGIVGDKGDADNKLQWICDNYVASDYIDGVREFINLQNIDDRMKDEPILSYEFIGKTEGWCRAYIIAGDREKDGSLRHVYIATREINEEKEREDFDRQVLEYRVRENREYKKIIYNARLGIWFIYLKDDCIPRMKADIRMREFLGIDEQYISEEEIYSWWYTRICEEDIEIVNDTVNKMLSGVFAEATYKWNHPKHGIIYVRCGGTCEDRGDEGLVLSGYHSDVNDIVLAEKKREEELTNALSNMRKANNAKNIFMNNMSHDIRTPMNAILGYTTLLKKNGDNKEQRERYIESIYESGDQLLNLLNNVLEMSYLESGKILLNPELVDAEEFVNEMAALFSREYATRNLTIERQININHQHVMLDKEKCKEIYTNVVGNAIKYTPDGGKVSIIVNERATDVEGHAYYDMIVRDNGVGMSKEFLPYVFDSFTRERNTTECSIAGTGLGMGIVKKLVELMGGKIKVESEIGKGTSIMFDIPVEVSTPIVDKKEDNTFTGASKYPGKRVLLAEDNDLNAEITTEILAEMDIMVERAEDGDVCVDMLKNAEEGYYDMILMDIQMPNMDGYEATKHIRSMENRKKASIPIVALTANVFAEDMRRSLANGMNGHLGKPINIVAMIGEFNKYLRD